MSRHETGRFKLSEGWNRGEDWWGDWVSRNFSVSDLLLHPHVKSMSEVQPPQLNALGDTYIVPAGGEGPFKGQDGKLAMLSRTGWLFLEPVRGVRVRCDNPDDWFWFNGDAWVGEDWKPDAPAPLGTRYDVIISVTFEAQPGDKLCCVYIPQPMVLPSGTPNSGGRSADWPPGTIILPIRRNGAEVGQITFTPSSLSAEITVDGDKQFGEGDLLEVVLPPTVPDGFQNYGITLRFLINQ